jgi:hypothetical protein
VEHHVVPQEFGSWSGLGENMPRNVMMMCTGTTSWKLDSLGRQKWKDLIVDVASGLLLMSIMARNLLL